MFPLITFYLLKSIMCICLVLLFIGSFCDDLGVIIINVVLGLLISLALALAWNLGLIPFRAVLTFSLFVLVMASLQFMELVFR